MRFEVLYKTNNTTEIVDTKGLFEVIKNTMKDATLNFHNSLYYRIVSSPNCPYDNGIIKIKTLDIKKSRKHVWSRNAEVPVNVNRDAAQYSKVNEWIVFNNKTNKYSVFNNLAALCRAMNINYAYLYPRIKYSHTFTIDKFTFTHSSMLEKDFYKTKIQEIL